MKRKKKAQAGIKQYIENNPQFQPIQIEPQPSGGAIPKGMQMPDLSFNTQNISVPNRPLNFGQSKQKDQKNSQLSELLATGLTLVDALIPGQKPKSPIVRPELSYNPYQYGTGSQAIAKDGLKVSTSGYKKTSKDKNKKALRIPSDAITMKDVPHPVVGIDNMGNQQFMLPNQEYVFPGADYVDEFPVKAQMGRTINTLDAANQEAKRFALSKGLIAGENTHVGNQLPRYKTPQGQDVTGQPEVLIPQSRLVKKLPSYVTKDSIQWDERANLPYFISEETGDIEYTTQDNFWKFNRKMDHGGYIIPDMTRNRKKMKHGGKLETLTDDTVQFNGPSHEDGGIDISYAGKGVEVEGGETGYISPIDNSLNIMGNMINPLTGKKFKEDSKNLAKKEQKVDKLLDYSIDLVENSNPGDKWELLKFNSGKVQMEGAARKKQELLQSKEHLATIQKAMLDFAAENNTDPLKFSKAKDGTIIFPTKKQIFGKAQDGKKLSVAQRHNNPGNIKYAKWLEKYGAIKGDPDNITKDGTFYAKFPDIEKGKQAMKNLLQTGKNYKNLTVAEAANRWTGGQAYKNLPIDLKNSKIKDLSDEQFVKVLDSFTIGEDSKKYNWEGVSDVPQETIDNQLVEDALDIKIDPSLKRANKFADRQSNPQRIGQSSYDLNIKEPRKLSKPSNIKNLSLDQIAPELLTLANNKVEPVFMQQYHPDLYQSYNVSFQDQLNENNATFLPLAKSNSRNPSVQAALAAQKYGADQSVLANQFRTNQAIEQDIVNKNIGLLNEAELKNLQLADTQYVRQEQARSNTKLQNQFVLQSIADKLHQNELEKRTLQVYENMYPYYAYDKNYKLDYYGPTPGETLTPLNPQSEVVPQVTVKSDNTGKVTTTRNYPSTIQQDLNNLRLKKNTIDYTKGFANWMRNEKKLGSQ